MTIGASDMIRRNPAFVSSVWATFGSYPTTSSKTPTNPTPNALAAFTTNCMSPKTKPSARTPDRRR